MKHALVHSGGGANGAWGLGVMKYMIDVLGFDWDIVVGTSVGALNGAGMAMYSKGQAEEALTNLLRIWSEVTPDQIYKHWWPGGTLGDLVGLLWKNGIYNTKPVQEFVARNFDQAKLAASDRELAVATVNLNSGNLTFFDDQDPLILKGILASSSYPVFFQPVKIDASWYSDGGLVEIVPLREAVRRGATLIDVIVCQPEHEGTWDAEGKTTLETLPRLLGLMTTEIANDDILTCADYPDVEIRVWRPPKGVGSGLDFEQEKVQRLIDEGYKYALNRAIDFGLSARF